MPMLLAGNGSITGATSFPTAATFGNNLSVSGYANVTQGLTTASRGINNASLPAGAVLQIVNFQTGSVLTGSTQIPLDDTIPQNTEGDEYFSLAITPKSATSKLKIDVNVCVSHNYAGALSLTAALFQDSTANALAASHMNMPASNYRVIISFTHFMTSGTTSSTTFKVRAGGGAAGTMTLNGYAANRVFGGFNSSSITITEIAT